jgi:hypothetical protein
MNVVISPGNYSYRSADLQQKTKRYYFLVAKKNSISGGMRGKWD